MNCHDPRGFHVWFCENAGVIVLGIGSGALTLNAPWPGYDVARLLGHVVEAAH